MVNEPGEQSLMAHLLELRQRLLYAVIAVGGVFVLLLPFANDLYAWLAQPLLATLADRFGPEIIAAHEGMRLDLDRQ